VLGPLGLGLLYDVTGGFDAGLYALTAVAAAMAFGAVRLAAMVRRAAPVGGNAQEPIVSGMKPDE
jgi:cyanate permease